MRAPIEQPTTRRQESARVVRERSQRGGRLANEGTHGHRTGPGHKAQTLDRMHVRMVRQPGANRSQGGGPDTWCLEPPALALEPVVTTPIDIEITAIDGEPRALSAWLTMFPLLPVVLDPFTHESAWILDTARRILVAFSEAGCRPCFVLTSSADDARRFLGPYADEILTFADPDRTLAAALGISSVPAFLLIKQDGSVAASAEGWDPDAWRDVAEAVAELSQWTRPVIPGPGDPGPFSGTPVAG